METWRGGGKKGRGGDGVRKKKRKSSFEEGEKAGGVRREGERGVRKGEGKELGKRGRGKYKGDKEEESGGAEVWRGGSVEG